MHQKQRDKIAWGLAGVLVPLLIYLLVTNVARVGKKNPPPAPLPAPATIMPAGAPGTGVVPPAGDVPATTSSATGGLAGADRPLVDPKISAEQKKIAALLPENNPFNPSRAGSAEPAPADPVSKTTAPPPPVAAPPPAATIRLTAIVARGNGRMAMINGRFLGEGDHIANWTVIKVTATEVLLDNGTEKKILRLR